MVEVEKIETFCDICGEFISESANIWNTQRDVLIKGLIPKRSLDAHETCVNKVIREAFEELLGKDNS